ncbi:PGF-pre-PGF domain-containing protein [Methanofollis formosanus]|uniref:PGF-pre-PGF domain-containing protein n=1 Tax=Methanofollis formosanus TaxID=299308 RepID=A0A8G1EGC9_9EURY|nr:NosD domain-containing protein [Methanofollis formosanus]QYZ79021.1 PGF-pre-PGF domain-containing protein [Methanofollis formosanus]
MKKKKYDGPVLVLACALILATLCSCAVPAAATDIVPDGKYPIWINESGLYALKGNILTGNVSSDWAIIINASDVVLDGGGYIIDGQALNGSKVENGIGMEGSSAASLSNITLRDITISGFYRDIMYAYVDGGAIEGCRVAMGRQSGLYLYRSKNIVVAGNTIADNFIGFDLYSSNFSTIYNNVFKKNKDDLFYGGNPNTWNVTRRSGPNIIGGPSIGGNYWGRYANATDGNSDGFCDEPYEVYNNGEGVVFYDMLPLFFTIPPTIEPTTEPTAEPTRVSSSDEGDDWADRVSAHGPIPAGGRADFTFRNLPITRVDLSVTSPVGGALVAITPNDLPPDADAPEGRAVLGVYEIVIRYVDDNLDECLVSFEIPENWLAAKGLKPADIVLKYYDDGVWKDLPTELLRLEGGKAYYRAQASGYPYFAIAETRGGAVTPTPVATSAEAEAEDTPVTKTEVGTEVETEAETTAATTAPDAAETTAPQPSPLSCLAAAAACALVVLVMRRD